MSVLILQCSRCKAGKVASHDKTASEFHKCSDINRGFAWECKACRKACAAAKYRGLSLPPTIGFDKKYEPNQSANVTEMDRAYISGLIDAEGSITMCGAATQYASRLTIYNNDVTSLEFVKSKFGGRLYEVKRVARKDCIERALGFETQSNLSNIAKGVVEFLITKKPQCEVVLRAIGVAPSERPILREKILDLNRREQRESMKKPESGARRSLGLVKPTDWAYLSGWIDGDGTFQMQPQSWRDTEYHYPWILIYSTKRKALDYLYGVFGGTLKFRSRSNRWTAEGCLRFEDQAYTPKLLAGILPHIKAKREQCELLIESLKFPANERSEFRKQLDVLNAKFRRKFVT